ncbi:Hypothetical predicted protein [Pelobates cultripes]|uniref:SGNH hydrolase-type esterase domain-containing protein n=1 Tax=Pelobates cultripes TaxID=61616 RepID=A0AAD1S4T0_PELCU|nr:Hypothetical predicted protein [Pelobates cultripes]
MSGTIEALLEQLKQKALGCSDTAWLQACLESAPSTSGLIEVEEEEGAELQEELIMEEGAGYSPQKLKGQCKKENLVIATPAGFVRQERSRETFSPSPIKNRKRMWKQGRKYEQKKKNKEAEDRPRLFEESEAAQDIPGCSHELGNKKPAIAWVIGHSFIFWAQKRAKERSYGENLGLESNAVKVFWKGIRGAKWSQLFEIIQQCMLSFPYPEVVIVHLGGNDIGSTKSVNLIKEIKSDLVCITQIFPDVRFIWSEIIPRHCWLKVSFLKPLERVRRKVSRALEKFLPTLGMTSYRHRDIEGNCAGFYRSDEIHLSDIGLDIFNLGIQSMLEMAMGVGGPPSLVAQNLGGVGI